MPDVCRLVLEKLTNALRWGRDDGLAALILSPTRELAIQIFEVLHLIGPRHPFSAGLLIGGKDFEVERKHIISMNILVCTRPTSSAFRTVSKISC